MRLQGKVALVTGAAMGLGAAFAKALAEEGAAVALCDVNVEEGEARAAEIRHAGGTALFVSLDVTSEDGWVTALSQVKDELGGLNVVVNNAGIAAGGTVADTTLEDWNKALAVNLTGVFLGNKHTIPHMAESGGGSIINISSIFGQVSDSLVCAYSASKGGVRSLTKSAALYCAEAQNGIRVNSVHPGFVMTPMVANAASQVPAEIAEPYMARTVGQTPLGRIGEPEDLTGAIVFLASDDSRFLTGSEVTVDGGFTAR